MPFLLYLKCRLNVNTFFKKNKKNFFKKKCWHFPPLVLYYNCSKGSAVSRHRAGVQVVSPQKGSKAQRIASQGISKSPPKNKKVANFSNFFFTQRYWQAYAVVVYLNGVLLPQNWQFINNLSFRGGNLFPNRK